MELIKRFVWRFVKYVRSQFPPLASHTVCVTLQELLANNNTRSLIRDLDIICEHLYMVLHMRYRVNFAICYYLLYDSLCVGPVKYCRAWWKVGSYVRSGPTHGGFLLDMLTP